MLSLVVHGPRNFDLLVDGETTKVDGDHARIPAGREVRLTLRARGFKAETRTLMPKANGRVSWTVSLEKEIAIESGQPWTVPDLGLAMVWINPGEFNMGSLASETGHEPDEEPQTRVRLTQGFWLGTFEVMQGEWVALMGKNPSKFTAAGMHAPVEQVSWEDAMAFCRKLTERERAAGRLPAGFAYTLPTEAQWEYACRAGTTTAYSFGDDESRFARFGNFADRNVSFKWRDGNQDDGVGETTAPAGRYLPNAWGLYDMLGNVCEWCADWYAPKLPGGTVADPTGPPTGTDHVFRGGSWGLGATHCRSAVRGWDKPDKRGHYLGFRVALCATR